MKKAITLNKSSLRNNFKDNYNAIPFLLSVFIYGITNGITKGIQDNYLAQIIFINEFERGVIEFLRELPGLFLIIILAWLYRLSDKRNYQVALIISIIGTAGLALLHNSKWLVISFLVINSLGEHIIMQVRQSITIHMAKKSFEGKALGTMTSIRSVGRILGFLIIPIIFYILSKFNIKSYSEKSFRYIYFFAFLVIILAFVITSKIPNIQVKEKGPKIYFHKKYFKYYMLSIFYGARKQVFLTFAPFVIILQYKANASVMSLLFAITAGLSIIFSPIIGKIIDKVGYKKVMIADTLILIIVCFFYGFSHRIFSQNIAFVVVCINYVLDSIISLCSLASLLYVKDLSDNQKEVSQTISTGISVNHLISIIIALLGGLIWERAGLEVLFTVSAILGLINSIFASTIKSPNKNQAKL